MCYFLGNILTHMLITSRKSCVPNAKLITLVYLAATMKEPSVRVESPFCHKTIDSHQFQPCSQSERHCKIKYQLFLFVFFAWSKQKCTTLRETRWLILRERDKQCLSLTHFHAEDQAHPKHLGFETKMSRYQCLQNLAKRLVMALTHAARIRFPAWWTNVGFPWFGNQCSVSRRRNRYVEVWGVAQRSSCLRGMTVVACRDAGFPKRYQRGSLSVQI